MYVQNFRSGCKYTSCFFSCNGKTACRPSIVVGSCGSYNESCGMYYDLGSEIHSEEIGSLHSGACKTAPQGHWLWVD